MKNLLAFILAISIPIFIHAQTTNAPNLQMGYYGDIIFHPGLKIGYEMPLKNWTSTKDKKQQTINKYKSWNVGFDIAYYKHPKHHHGLIFSPNIAYRRTKANGKFSQFKLNVGYHRSFVDGTTYFVSDIGEVTTENNTGQNTLYRSLSYSSGKDLRLKKNIPIRYYWEFGVNQRTPYNHTSLLGIHFGLGIHYFLK